MKNKKLVLLLLPVLVILSGCGVTENHLVGPDASGIWDTIVMLFSKGIIYLGSFLGNNIIMGLIAMTILFRLALVPLYKKQIKSSADMAKIQPEIKKIQAKYKNKKEVEDKRKMQMEMQSLYSRHNINPLAGCLPILIQMPLLFAFYDAIQNLLIYDGLPLYGAQGMARGFLIWPNFGKPIVIMAILAAVTTYFSTVVSTIGTDTTGTSSTMMKQMKIIMPIMILIMGLTLPGALSIYWVISNSATILQTVILKRDVISAERQKKKIKK